MVQNEHGLLVYDAESNQYYEYEYEPSAETGGHTRPTLIGSSPTTDFDVSYDGTDTVAGRETHVLTFRPTEEADSFIRQLDYVTMWVDGTYWFPLREEASHQLRNEGLLRTDTDEDLRDEKYVQTKTFEEIAFDTGIEDSMFQLELPEDAERVES
ncbi:LolA family protein [Haladaptatus sp. DFWS20]|uniref:LolA family protein n=1 Tax=Haladaptatus sp. DFWS20 TaxID=3403467 RepID=UPI003EBD4F83